MTNAKRVYEDKTIRTINQTQLAHSNNSIDILDLVENLAPESYVKSRGTNLTLNEPFVKHDAQPEVLGQNRFSRPVKPVEIEKE